MSKKKWLIIVASILVLFAICVCAATIYAQADKIKELKKKNKELADKINELEDKEFNANPDGAYFITDESYESYVRNCAKKVGADKEWIKDVLNGGDGGEWHSLIRPKSWFWCAIVDNQITVSKIGYDVYDIYSDGNIYQGRSITQAISFWFSGDFLYVNDNNETLEYKKDNSYQRTKTKDSVLAAPQDVTVSSGGQGLNYVMFIWSYRPDYGRVGAALEIKTASSQEYKTIEIDKVYMNMHVMQLDESKFEVGKNLVRIYHIGGPSITNDHSIIIRKNSDYATFRVTVSDDGSVDVEEINM